ncbi:MAG: cobyrinate a,c-diamide synthase, partial [Paracoccaceae bacterium]|nr:cobyrinate a,c-diamide synthase [Paracoccaceae bacterium]
MTPLPRFMISAAHKSSGKTVVSAGLARAYSRQNMDVGSFKKGPDYIDPLWLRTASANACYNLDFNTMSHNELVHLFMSRATGRDISIIEANKGLFDGINIDGTDSNAQLAKLLKTPIILVIDTVGMTRGIAPLLLGYQNFDPEIGISGVILNRTGGPRHEAKLRQAVETYTDIPVLGAIRRTPDMDIEERHLGLITPAENPETEKWLDLVAHLTAEQVDMDWIKQIADSAPDLDQPPRASAITATTSGLRIGIARDAAFGFYYADDLEAFETAGATLVPIDLIADKTLPNLDGLFIGGGFPETHMQSLNANASMRESISSALANGLSCYAECGGLMYLCKSLTYRDQTYDMAGFIDANVSMKTKPQGRGIVEFARTEHHLWGNNDGTQNAHEFHYAALDNQQGWTFGNDVSRGHGINGQSD